MNFKIYTFPYPHHHLSILNVSYHYHYHLPIYKYYLTFYDAPSDNLWLKFLYILPFIPFTILYIYLQILHTHAIPVRYTKGVYY